MRVTSILYGAFAEPPTKPSTPATQVADTTHSHRRLIAIAIRAWSTGNLNPPSSSVSSGTRGGGGGGSDRTDENSRVLKVGSSRGRGGGPWPRLPRISLNLKSSESLMLWEGFAGVSSRAPPRPPRPPSPLNSL